MKSSSKSMRDWMDEYLKNSQSGYYSIGEFITDDEKSVKFIQNLSHDDGYLPPVRDPDIFRTAEVRARHCAITYILGLVFYNCCEFLKEKISQNDFERYWLLISLYHDIGFYSEYLKRDDLNYQNTFKSDYLAETEDFGDVLAYTAPEILRYDQYAREFHKRQESDNEKIDHGILSGYILFNKNKVKLGSNNEPVYSNRVLKECCLTIAQHNIYKSSSTCCDADYLRWGLERLISSSDFQISKKTPLLLFLSLIDTIECVKKFSKLKNSKKYIESLTVLKKIDVQFQTNMIILDYSKLWNHIIERSKEKKIDSSNEELAETFQTYMNSLANLHSWTVFSTTVENIVSCDTNRIPVTLHITIG